MEKNRNWVKSQLRITWHLPIVILILSVVYLISTNYKWLTSDPPRIITLSGSHYQMGLKHGKELKTDIHELYEKYIIKGLVDAEGWSEKELLTVAHHYEKFIPEEYLDEIKGIAEGSEISVEKVLIMNTFSEAMLGNRIQACSSFAVKQDDEIIVGRNFDWINFDIAHKKAIVFILKPQGGHAVLNISWPGIVGVVTGMSNKGLSLSLNMAYASDLHTECTPVLFRTRKILETCNTINDALEILIKEPRSIAVNVLLSSKPDDNAVVIELSGEQHALLNMKNGRVVTTNHYRVLDIHGGAGGDRTVLIEKSLVQSDILSRRKLKGILSRVCFCGNSFGMVTGHSVIMYPGEGIAYVALGKVPASSGKYYPVNLNN